MALRVLAIVALAPLATAAEPKLPDMSAMHAKCYSLLQGMSSSAYSKTELAMICRSKLPIEACRAAAAELGEKPWQPSTIGRTCGRWQEQWADRALQMDDRELQDSYQDWQAQVDDIMKKKAAVGLCKEGDGEPMPVDKCAAHKKEEYPKYTKELNDALSEKYAAWKGQADEQVEASREAVADSLGHTDRGTDDAEAMNEAVEEVNHALEAEERLYSKTRLKLPGTSSGLLTVVGLAGVSFAMLGGAFVAVRRRVRKGAVRVDSEADSSDAEISVQ